MINENDYPILEFDEESKVIINHGTFAEATFNTNKLIITFFKEVVT